ncbi:MAG: hypothetical protein KDK29_02580 [Sedimentitalea sp.]|nr:hypothetical protein [Sedimentitalea sp.]
MSASLVAIDITTGAIQDTAARIEGVAPAGLPKVVTADPECYAPEHVGMIGEADWTGCAGMLILE